MKHIYIKNPCSENWNDMLPTQQGAFCKQCSKEVIDFTQLTRNETKHTLFQNRNSEMCGRVYTHQLEKLNAEFDTYSFRSTKSFQSALLFSLVVVFGMTLFSCSNSQQQQEVEQLRSQVKDALKELTVVPTNAANPIDAQNAIAEVAAEDSTYTFIETDPACMDLELGGIEFNYRHPGLYESPEIVENDLKPTLIINEELDANGIPYPTQFDALVYPNPTTGPATFKLDIPEKQHFLVQVVNGNGQLVDKLHDGTIDRGTYRQEMDLSTQPPGMYYVTIFSDSFRSTVKISKL